MNTSPDAQFARDQQMAADMQFAEELQAQQDQAQQQQRQQQEQQRNGSQGTLFRYPGNSRSNSTPVVQGLPVPGRSSLPFPPPAASLMQPPSRRDNGSLSSSITDDGSSVESSLLHVPCEINDRVVEMMVDTGAQSSVISAPLMRTLGLQHLLNTFYQGVAAGVGRARILGKIERCPVQIGQVEFLLHLLVLDVNESMMILGVDQLKRFKCMIDLNENKLIFGGPGGVAVDFLPPEPKFALMRNAALESCTIS